MATFQLIITGDLGELGPIAAALGCPQPQPDLAEVPEDNTGAHEASGLTAAAAEAPKARAGRKGKTTEAIAAAAPAATFDPFAAGGAGGPQPGANGTIAVVKTTGAPGEITYETLKDLMNQLLEKTSALTAQTVISEATGSKSLSTLTADQYPKAHAALTAALAG